MDNVRSASMIRAAYIYIRQRLQLRGRGRGRRLRLEFEAIELCDCGQ